MKSTKIAAWLLGSASALVLAAPAMAQQAIVTAAAAAAPAAETSNELEQVVVTGA